MVRFFFFLLLSITFSTFSTQAIESTPQINSRKTDEIICEYDSTPSSKNKCWIAEKENQPGTDSKKCVWTDGGSQSCSNSLNQCYGKLKKVGEQGSKKYKCEKANSLYFLDPILEGVILP